MNVYPSTSLEGHKTPKLLAAIRRMPEVEAAIELCERESLPTVGELTHGRVRLRSLLARAEGEHTGISIGHWTKYRPALQALLNTMAARRQHAMQAERTPPKRAPWRGRGPDGDGDGLPLKAVAA